jgi:hypothetical protein
MQTEREVLPKGFKTDREITSPSVFKRTFTAAEQ